MYALTFSRHFLDADRERTERPLGGVAQVLKNNGGQGRS
jgi:hypothetical protein